MRKSCNLSRPVAQFLIERVPGIGYSITSSSGPESSALEKEALMLLDEVKQPNANQVGLKCVWLGPVGEKPYFVGVSTILTETGDTQFTQFWFIQKKPRVINTLLLLGLFLALPLGIFIGTEGNSPHKNMPPVIVDSNKTGDESVPPAQPQRDKSLDEFLLLLEEKETSDLRNKITSFLQQKGLAADPTKPNQEKIGSISLNNINLKTSDVEKDILVLDNFDVRMFLDLLDHLNKLVKSRQENSHN